LERHDKDLLIIDTKYKVRQADARDKKKGVAQTDMYQMLSYGYRRGCKRIILLYPGVDGDLPEDFSFNIATEFSNNPRIEITIGEVPFWGYGSPDNLEKNLKARLAQLLKV
jgi:5-methylcytosine-specific restriction enzyme subunit McrC